MYVGMLVSLIRRYNYHGIILLAIPGFSKKVAITCLRDKVGPMLFIYAVNANMHM